MNWVLLSAEGSMKAGDCTSPSLQILIIPVLFLRGRYGLSQLYLSCREALRVELGVGVSEGANTALLLPQT